MLLPGGERVRVLLLEGNRLKQVKRFTRLIELGRPDPESSSWALVDA